MLQRGARQPGRPSSSHSPNLNQRPRNRRQHTQPLTIFKSNPTCCRVCACKSEERIDVLLAWDGAVFQPLIAQRYPFLILTSNTSENLTGKSRNPDVVAARLNHCGINDTRCRKILIVLRRSFYDPGS